MKRILGLDLGTNSIGWAIIIYDDETGLIQIVDMGSRIIPIDGQTLSKFGKGQSVTINSDRTQKRTARKIFDRYQMRREELIEILKSKGIEISDSLSSTEKLSLWQMRAAAAEKKLSLDEIARVLLHIMQKRGYRAVSSDLSDKKQSEYLDSVAENYKKIKDANKTIGQYYYQQLLDNSDYRIKERVLPRQAYVEEYDVIMNCQKQFYPDVFTDKVISDIKNHIIFYQRPLKSCKHLISQCALESREIKKGDKTIVFGPKVANKSNPIYELFRIWETINRIVFEHKNNPNEKEEISLRVKELIADHLKKNEKMTATQLFKIVELSNRTYNTPEIVGKGIAGNRTYRLISQALNNKYPELLRLQLFKKVVDPSSGELKMVPVEDVTKEPLYQLWHILYSIKDQNERVNRLSKAIKFKVRDADGCIVGEKQIVLDQETIENLIKIDFSTIDYGNLSVKAIMKLLPYLMNGENYPMACDHAGYRHSGWVTKEENESRQLQTQLKHLKKGELHQPVVEKIINQLVTITNALLQKYGEFDEIHVELARELKQNKQKREKTAKDISKNEKINKEILERFEKEYNQRLSRSRIKKYKLLEETNFQCIYCGKKFEVKNFLNNEEIETEHIIPKSLLFDDSFGNQVCSCRACNKEKGNQTAFDYMKSKGDNLFKSYIERIHNLVESGEMSKKKQERLLTTKSEIPQDFIERQIKETQYISKYALNLLKRVCRDVFATSGTITDYVKHIWGWDRVLHDVNLPIYSRNEDLIETCDGVTTSQHGIIIKDWNKRVDHRHHAIDALVIACTNRALIQRLNSLNAIRNDSGDSSDGSAKFCGLEKFVLSMPHFSFKEVYDAANGIVVSCKEKKAVATRGKRYVKINGRRKVVQTDIIVPRGALHEEKIYGAIKQYNKDGILQDQFVIKRKLEDIKTEKDAALIVDTHIRNIILERIKSVKDEKTRYAEPLYSDKDGKKQIRSVRCFSTSTALIPVRKGRSGEWIAYAEPGGNDHLAVYVDENGKYYEHVPTFKHCVDRYRYDIPTIIEDPKAIWDIVLQGNKDFSEDFLSNLPKDNWTFRFSLRIRDLIVFNMTREEVEEAIRHNQYDIITKNLYRVQSLSRGDYRFILNTQTQFDRKYLSRPDKRFVYASLSSFLTLNPVFVKVDPLGKISIK